MNISSPHYWPAEWSSQAATWIAWPHNQETWPGRFGEVPAAFLRFVTVLCEVQQVHVLISDNAIESRYRDALERLPQVELVEIETNDCWIRDFGPTMVKRRDDHSLVGVCWRYNGWGEKYPPFDKDAAAATKIVEAIGCPRSNSSLYCEGGALETNGQGILFSTQNCLLNPNRNPGWTQSMVEDELKMQLGVEQIVWVDGGGLKGDDTDGHIDQLARFTNENTVVAAVANPQDENYVGLEENVRILREVRQSSGQPLNVVRLPIPPARFVDHQRVPESYCNFVIANETVIVPTFRNERTDHEAIDLLGSLFPSRTMMPIDAHDLVWGLGAFHCASQQQPSAVQRRPLRNARARARQQNP
ncbi:MAG: agmatine deiminase family protein [Planctomycetota bacterium]